MHREWRRGGTRHGWRAGRLRTAAVIVLAAVLSSACGLSAAPPHGQSEVSLSAVLKRTPSIAQATLSDGTPLGISTMQFADARHGWLGGLGVILATSDGGASWHTQFVGSGNVTDFSMLSPTTGFAATSAGLLALNGQTWRRVGPQPLAAVQFFSELVGYAESEVGNGGPVSYSVLKTQDGGASWRTIAAGPVEAACFFSLQDGIAVSLPSSGFGLNIQSTRDGGATWSAGTTLQAAGYARQLVCTKDGGAWMVVGGEGAMTRESYTLYRSPDYGATWSPVLGVPLFGGITAPGNPTGVAKGPGTSPGPLAAVDGSHAVMLGVCYVCGDGTLTLDATSDGGKTWQLSKAPIPGAAAVMPMFLDMLSPMRAWLLTGVPTVGIAGPATQFQVQSTGDGGTTWHATLTPVPLAPVGGVVFPSAEVGYGLGAAGNAKAVVQTENGGRSWRKVGALPASVPAGYYALAVTKPGTLLVGAGRSLYVSHDGGVTFSRAAGPSAPYGFGLSSLAFSGPKTGCTSAAGPNGWIDYATRDGGKSWHRAGVGGQPAAICAEELVDRPLARLTQRLILKLAPQRRGKGSPAGIYAAAQTAVGGGTLWVVFSGSPTQVGRVYEFGPGPKQFSVYTLPAALGSVGDVSPLGPTAAYLWTENGRLFATADGGAHWRQVAER